MMTFRCLDFLWSHAINNVLQHGQELVGRSGHGTREIIGYGAKLDNVDWCYLTCPVRKLSPAYASAELLWYLSGTYSGDMIKAYAPSYHRFLSANGEAYGAYGPRIMERLPAIITTLRNAPHSRQAVLPIWEPEIINACSAENSVPDVPCTVSLQYFIRQDKLHAVTHMRSNDIWLGMPYDIFCFAGIQRLVAAEVGLSPGTYTHLVGSLHIYDKDIEACRESVEAIHQVKKAMELEHRNSPSYFQQWTDSPDTLVTSSLAVSVERIAREHQRFNNVTFGCLGPMMKDLVAACLAKTYPIKGLIPQTWVMR